MPRGGDEEKKPMFPPLPRDRRLPTPVQGFFYLSVNKTFNCSVFECNGKTSRTTVRASWLPFKTSTSFSCSLTDKPLFEKRLVFPDERIHGTFENTRVKCPRVAPNAQPPGRDKIANAPPPDWQREQMPRGYRGWGWGMGTAVIDWCIIKFIKSLWGIKRLNLHLKFYDTTR